MEKREIETLFKNVTELAEAKKLYKKLAKQLHPDVGGDEESFKALNAVYNHILEHGLFFSSEIEFDIEIEKIISQILHYENILIEVVGKWIWISGDTKEIKEALKNLGRVFRVIESEWDDTAVIVEDIESADICNLLTLDSVAVTFPVTLSIFVVTELI